MKARWTGETTCNLPGELELIVDRSKFKVDNKKIKCIKNCQGQKIEESNDR